VALPSCESSGVYAISVHLLSVNGFWTDLSGSRYVPRLMG
jgi:hypothetical protein